MIFSKTPTFEGHPIRECCGVVTGETIKQSITPSQTCYDDKLVFCGRFCVLSRFVFLRDAFGIRQLLDSFSIGSRSVFDHPSIILRSSFVRSSIRDRRTIEERLRKQHSFIGGLSQDYRSIIGVLQESEPMVIRQTVKNALLSMLFQYYVLLCR